jgi:hypothetical protein
VQAAAIPLTKARVELGDITQFALGRAFDLIIAPYRVFQLLETEAQVDGLFQCVRAHLAPRGTCILNVFHPQGGFEGVQQEWERATEKGRWEVTVEALVGFQGRVCADGVQPDLCYALLPEALIFQ